MSVVKPHSPVDYYCPQVETQSTSRVSTGWRMVHVVERMTLGGIETLVIDLVRHRRGQDHIISLSGTVDDLVAQWPALAMLRGKFEALDRPQSVDPGLVLALALRLVALKPAAVVLHHIGPLLYGGLAARLAGVPVILHVEHDSWHYREKRRRTLFKLFSWLCRARHIAVSHEIASTVRSFCPRTVMTVIPPGVDTSRFTPNDGRDARLRLSLDPSWTIIGTVGRLVPEKGQEILIAALVGLPETVHLVLVGGGPMLRDLLATAERLGVSQRVHFVGWKDELERIYPAFDLFCLPSRAEGLPRAVLEAQACGVAVVASDVGAMRDAVCPVTGILVPHGDPHVIATALFSVLGRQQKQSPRDHVLEAFSLQRTAAAYQQMIEEAHPWR
jgi:glycosyltransferase involved in cell wall biosynthesis